MKTFGLTILLTAIGVAAATAGAAPYRLLEAFCTTVQMINNKQDLKYTSAALLITSTNPNVAPTNIVLTIHSKSGNKELRVGPGGIIKLKPNPALASENPDVSLNQPKGTVNIRMQPYVRAPIALASTLDVANEMSAEYKRVRKMAPLLERTYRALVRFVRLVPERGETIAATTNCGITFSRSPDSHSLQTPMASFPNGCTLTVVGNAERIELVFDQ